MQAAQRGKAAAPTQAEAGDPLGSQYGDTSLIQSRSEATETYHSINSLSVEQNEQTVRYTPSLIDEMSCICLQLVTAILQAAWSCGDVA